MFHLFLIKIILKLKQPLIFSDAVFSSVSSLTLPYMVTSKPKHIKQMGAQASEGKTQVNPTSQSVTSKPSGVSVYRVTDSKGSTCILLQTDGLIEVSSTYVFMKVLWNMESYGI